MKYVGTYSDPKDIVTKDKLEAVASRVSTNEDNIAMAESDIDGLQTDVGTLKTNVTSLQTALTSKQDVIVGAASTITENNLTINRALVSNSSGKVAVSNVTSTELGYLDGVTSNVQTQLDKKLEKAPVTSVNSKTGTVQLNASDVGALPNTTVIPSKTSQLNNDSGFITELPIASTTQIGGVKIGTGLSVTENGTLSATGGGGSSEAFVAVFGIHGENTYDKSPAHATTTTYENIVAAYNAKTPCYAKIRIIGTDYDGYVVAPLAYVDEVYGEVYFASTRMTKGNTPKELIICYAAIDFEGNAEGYFGIQYTLSSTDKVLPPVTTDDNGKFLRVVNGAWSAETIPSANGGSF